MIDEHLTRFIKEALENIPVDLPADAWYQFYAKHSDSFIDKPIDNAVYQGLTNLPLILNLKPDWTAFITEYEIHGIDDFMKETLQEQESIPEVDWDEFSSKLDTVEAEEFDEYIRNSLDNFPTDVRPEAWASFNAYMQGKIRAATFLWTSRILEFMAMLFILWMIIPSIENNSGPKHMAPSDNITTDIAQEMASDLDISTQVRETTEEKSTDENTFAKADKTKEKSTDDNTFAKADKTEEKSTGDNTFAKADKTKEKSTDDNTFAKADKTEEKSTDDNTFAKADKTKEKSTDDNTFAKADKTKEKSTDENTFEKADKTEEKSTGENTFAKADKDIHKAVNTSQISQQNEDIISESFSSLSMLNLTEIKYSKSPVIYAVKTKTDNDNRYISLYFNQRLDIIDMPYDNVFKIGPMKSIQVGYGIGLDYIYQAHKRVEIGTGIAFNKYNYEPPIVTEKLGSLTSGIQTVSLHRIKFSELKIPLQIRFTPYAIKRFSLMMSAGINMHILTHTDYDIRRDYFGQDFLGNAIPAEQLRELSADLEYKPFQKGIMDGGKMESNVFATGFIGLGSKYFISREMQLFFLTEYNQYIGHMGIGPNSDRLHSLNFKVGIEFKI